MANPWWLVIFFIIHDGEEALFLPPWVEKNTEIFTGIKKRFPRISGILNLLLSSDHRQFVFSVIILLVILCLICGLAAAYPAVGWIQDVFLSSLIVYTAHLIIHVFQSLFIRQAIPGVISSVVIFIPLLILWLNTINSRNMSLTHSLPIGLIGALILIPFFPLLMKFGQWLGKIRT